MKRAQVVENTVADIYKKVRNAVVETYQKIENGTVNTYQKIEDKFVSIFLEKINIDEKISEND